MYYIHKRVFVLVDLIPGLKIIKLLKAIRALFSFPI